MWPHRDCNRCKEKQQFNVTDGKWQTYTGLYFQVYPIRIKYGKENKEPNTKRG